MYAAAIHHMMQHMLRCGINTADRNAFQRLAIEFCHESDLLTKRQVETLAYFGSRLERGDLEAAREWCNTFGGLVGEKNKMLT